MKRILPILLIIRVRAYATSVILPQRLDFVLPVWQQITEVQLKYLDIQPVRKLGYYLGYLFSFILAFPKIIFSRYDFLLLENSYLTIFAPLAWFRHKKVLAEYVDYYPANLLRLYQNRRFRFYITVIICRFFHHFVNIVTTESLTSKNTLNKLGVPSKKIVLIPVGVDTNKFKFEAHLRANIRQHLGISNNAMVIGYLGKIVDYYNLEIIPFALKAFLEEQIITESNVYLLVIGDGPYKHKFEQLCKNIKLKNVIFVGLVPHTLIPGYYAAMDLFLFPLNALAIKIGEALSMGLPIIVSPGMAEDWIKNENNGIVSKSITSDSFKQAIIKYFQMNSITKEKISINGRKYAKDNLDIKIVAKKYLVVLYSKYLAF